MLKKYEDLNYNAKEFFTEELDNLFPKELDKQLLERCYIEMNMLFEKGLLFIIKYLHKYHLENPEIKYYFKGMINNLLFLYVLHLSEVDPLKYNLPYELFTDKEIDVWLINGSSVDLARYLEKCSYDFKLVSGSFEREDIEEINELEDNHYLIIPKYYQPKDLTFRLNEFCHFETVEDYRLFKDKYLTIRLDDKKFIFEKDVDIKNALHTDFENEVSKLLKPKTVDDYVKVISLAHGTRVWKENQDELFKNGKIDIHSVISNREDVYEYLIHHSIEHDVAIDIVKQMSKARTSKSNKLWQKYVDIMKERDCDDMFIDIVSKVLYIFGRGQAVSECLYALDEKNYYRE